MKCGWVMWGDRIKAKNIDTDQLNKANPTDEKGEGDYVD
jgi:hypothetical protein